MEEDIKNSFVFHADWIKPISCLPQDKILDLLTVMTEFASTGEDPEIEDPMVKILFTSFQSRMESDRKNYFESRKRRSTAMKKAWEKKNIESIESIESIETSSNYKNLEESIETNSNYKNVEESIESSNNCSVNNVIGSGIVTGIVTGNVNGSDIKKEKEKENKSKRFVPPSFEEVKAYCLERQNNIDPQKFIDHYESVGWKKSSGTKVVDWKACVRTWEGRDNNYGGASTPRRSAVSEFFADCDDTIIDIDIPFKGD